MGVEAESLGSSPIPAVAEVCFSGAPARASTYGAVHTEETHFWYITISNPINAYSAAATKELVPFDRSILKSIEPYIGYTFYYLAQKEVKKSDCT